VALAAGFGLDLERCDPLVFEELEDILVDRQKEAERERMANELRQKMGR
jgi:hypothetical protein